MAEDLRGILADNPRWRKDLTDLGPRLVLAGLFAWRISRGVRVVSPEAR